MKVLIYGIGGTMGTYVFDCLKEEKDATAVCGVDKFIKENTFGIPVYKSCNEVNVDIDCIIDFSMHECIHDYIPYAIKNKIPCVIATTGFDNEEEKIIQDASEKIPVFQTGNMSLGINLLVQLVKQASSTLGDKADIEIIEMHHNKKLDAPSGTAKMLAESVKKELPSSKFIYGRKGIVGKRNKNEVGIHAIRGGSIVGKHDVMFILNNEVVTVSHESENKSIFAQGSVNAAKFLIKQNNGLYDMNDMLDL